MKLKELIKEFNSNPNLITGTYMCPFCNQISYINYLNDCNLILDKFVIIYVSSYYDFEIYFYKDYFEIVFLDGKDYPKTRYYDYKLIGDSTDDLESLITKYNQNMLFF